MAFTTDLRAGADPGSAILEMSGSLDSTTAPAFRAAVEEAVGTGAGQLVLDMTRLDYLSSAGLRVLVFARQKMRENTGLVLVGVNDTVAETIRLTGFDHSVTFGDRAPR